MTDIKDKDKIKEELIEASIDASKGYIQCAICSCELEMTKSFAETVGISSATCNPCRFTDKETEFHNKIHHYKTKLRLSNKEITKRLREDGYYV